MNDRPAEVVLLTPPGRGAIAVLLVAGEQALAAASTFFQPASGRSLAEMPLGRIVFGRWGEAGGEEVVVCRRAEQEVEIHCHGGAAAAAAILADLATVGCVPIPWRDWVLRREASRIAGEARIALASAVTERTAAILLDQVEGAWTREVAELFALIAAGRFADVSQRLAELLARAPLGRRLVEPWRVVVAGPPNVGKSRLVNALAGFDRAIVFDQPGTTRDLVAVHTAFDGWPVELVDTAGLRASGDELEAAGIAKAREALERADLVLLVADASQPWTAELAALHVDHSPALLVHNKADLVATMPNDRPVGLFVSAATGAGLPELQQAISTTLVPTPPADGEPLPFLPRHGEALRAALAAAECGDANAALAALQALEWCATGSASAEPE